MKNLLTHWNFTVSFCGVKRCACNATWGQNIVCHCRPMQHSEKPSRVPSYYRIAFCLTWVTSQYQTGECARQYLLCVWRKYAESTKRIFTQLFPSHKLLADISFPVVSSVKCQWGSSGGWGVFFSPQFLTLSFIKPGSNYSIVFGTYLPRFLLANFPLPFLPFSIVLYIVLLLSYPFVTRFPFPSRFLPLYLLFYHWGCCNRSVCAVFRRLFVTTLFILFSTVCRLPLVSDYLALICVFF